MKLRKSLCVGDGRLAFDAFGSTHHVRLTSAYCHLGTTISDHLGAGFDTRKKLAKGLGTIRPLASKVLRRPDVSLKCRREICLALGPTVAAFNCEVWGHLSLGSTVTTACFVCSSKRTDTLILPNTRQCMRYVVLPSFLFHRRA